MVLAQARRLWSRRGGLQQRGVELAEVEAEELHGLDFLRRSVIRSDVSGMVELGESGHRYL